MNTSQFPSPPAPPTQPGSAASAEHKSSWPTVIGVIAIIFGALGALGGLWGVVAPFVTPSLLANLPDNQEATLELMEEWKGWNVVSGLLTCAIAVLLLAAGIGLAKRRPWARSTCLTWAVLKILLVVANAGFGYVVLRQTFEAAQQQDPSMSSPPAGFFTGMAAFSVCFALVWGWALPVFLLIWLSRGKIKEEMVAWTVPAAWPPP